MPEAEPEVDPEEEPEPEAEPEAEPEPEPEPKKKRKKKKAKATKATKATKKGRAEEEPKSPKSPKEEPLPGAGTPEGERLAEARRLFEVGDYAQVRSITEALAEAEDPAVRDAARELRSRTEIDPVQVVVALACLGVLITIVYVWIL